MASQTPLETRDLNFDPQLNRDFSIQQVLYELLMNAIDQEFSSDPNEIITISGNTLTIQDEGEGITMKDFVLGTKSTMEHSVHGLGMKYAIAYCVLHNIELTIQTPDGTYSFDTKGEFNSIRVTLRRDVTPTEVGSKFLLRFSDQQRPLMQKALNETKRNFLAFRTKSKPILSRPGYDIYNWDNMGSQKGFFLNGIRKNGGKNRPYLFNFKDRSSELSRYIDENQCVRYDCWNKFEALIDPKDRPYWKKLPVQTINTIPPMVTTSKATASINAKPKATVVSSKLNVPETEVGLNNCLNSVEVAPTMLPIKNTVNALKSAMAVDNAPLYSMSDEQWDSINRARSYLDRKLKDISELSIAEIRNQGSLYKNTALPFDADIDIVLVLNEVPTRDKLLEIFQKNNDKLELAFLELGSCDILTGILRYEQRIFPIDIVVIQVGSNKRTDGYKHVEEILQKIGTENVGFEGIRILKYFCKRHNISVKSYYIEECVKKCFDCNVILSRNKVHLVCAVLRMILDDADLELTNDEKDKLRLAFDLLRL